MSEGWFPRGSTIGRLHVRLPAGDPSGPGGCATALRPLSLEPAGMPCHGILCVRALRDPLPGAMDLRSGDRRRPLAWEAAARTALADALRTAARPAHGPVNSTAGAVFFSDRAELLACAARDSCRGMLAEQWWWEHLLPARSFARVVGMWQHEPVLVPAALERLARMDRAALFTFLRALSPVQALRLLDAVCQAFALPAVGTAVVDILSRARPQWSRETGGTAGTRFESVAPARMAKPTALPAPPAPAPPPWRPVVTVDLHTANLEPETVSFAGIVLALRAAPELVRSRPFQAALLAYVAELRGPSPARDDSPTPSRREEAATSRAGRGNAAPPAPGTRREPREAPMEEDPRDSRPGHTRAHKRIEALRDDETGPRREIEVRENAGTSERTPGAPKATRHSFAAPQSPAPPAPPGPVGEAVAGVSVESEFAGVFFLLNVADDLELYRTGFAERADLEISIWDFLRLAGGDIAGKEFALDPVWSFLEGLADRSRGGQPWPPLRGPSHPRSEPHIDKVLKQLREHVRAVMGVEEPDVLLVRQTGRIVQTATHLDVHFSLERHPIEIRAGRLDRNPGWIPAAGLHVEFFFQ